MLPKPAVDKSNSQHHSSNVLAIQYSKQLKDLAQAQEKLKQQVSIQIEAEKAKLPLSFLFERNLDRLYCREKSVETIAKIFSKLQHRLVFAAFERWGNLIDTLQAEERKQAALKRSQVQALAFFDKLASDAYVGTLDRAFTRWRQTTEDVIAMERDTAATIIQVRYRQRRAKELLRGLKQASVDKEFKRKVEIQQLLRFEAYGNAMQWSTLRNGFNLLLQNHCARQIQFFFRRLMVQKRIAKRVVRSQAAIRIQAPWRRKLAYNELSRCKERLKAHQALERHAAIEIQRVVRGLLAKNEVKRRREWLANESDRAREIQTCWFRYRERCVLRTRLAARKLLLDAETERVVQLERERELERLELARHAAALTIQRAYRGFLGRKAFKLRLFERSLELAARRVQTSWRRSKGRYALQLRFSTQRERIEVRRNEAALQIQCCYRGFRAKRALQARREDLRLRVKAATTIQRVYRGRKQRSQYQRTRRATITIQSGIKGKLARLERQRRLDKRLAEFKLMTEAATLIQKWMRGVLGRMTATRRRELRAREQQLTQGAATLIQKRARGIEARKTAQLLREAMQMVELQQRRHYNRTSHQRESSPLLAFMTRHYLERESYTTDDNSDNGGGAVRFTFEQSVWLQERLQETRAQILKEDRAIVFLQRMYRGFVARVDYVVRKLRAKQRRKLEIKKAIVIQRYVRSWLARQHVKKLRLARRLEEIKQAYLRERRWKEDELKWKEQYQREQMELQLKQVKAMELTLKEAKRDAELAKWRAEAATFRKQELLAQQELDKAERQKKKRGVAGQDGTNEGGGNDEELLVEAEEGWSEMQDEYGNSYFYNEATSESAWERPMRRKEKPAVVIDEEAEASADGGGGATIESVSSGATSIKDGSSPAVDTAPGGHCCKCRTSVATKECLDCSGDLPQCLFCAPCFTSEHYALAADSNKQTHDFRVLVKVKKPSRCLSLACRTKEDTLGGEPTLATYYCGECSVLPPETTAISPPVPSPNIPASKGCFYCEECFTRAHESAQELQHVASGLHFRTGALLCCDCSSLVATRQCEQCDEAFCANCFEQMHSKSQKKREHSWTPIEILKEELDGSGKDVYCIECDLRRASRLCNLCGDGFCDSCFIKSHERGKKQQHTWISWSSFSQVGDWLEIFDDKAQTTIFFNIETKESTTKQPFILKTGAERHLLQFQEREQLQKRKELELETEIVSLKEKLKDITEKEALAQRPASRNLHSAGAGNGADGSPAARDQSAATPKKKGLIRRLFSRTSSPKGAAGDGLTPDERKRKELMHGIRSDEQALVLSKMKTRSREEKEAKATETLGTKQFEVSILQELAE